MNVKIHVFSMVFFSKIYFFLADINMNIGFNKPKVITVKTVNI